MSDKAKNKMVEITVSAVERDFENLQNLLEAIVSDDEAGQALVTEFTVLKGNMLEYTRTKVSNVWNTSWSPADIEQAIDRADRGKKDD